jgi:dipeptidyl aminopeptidase/acylaminoacyl peptidase
LSKPLDPETLVYGLGLSNDPQVSPDGARIVYARAVADRASKHATSQLWLRDLDGGNARRVTWNGERNWGARWSPDGKSIAFFSNRVKGSGLYVLPTDGPGEPRELAHHPGAGADIDWSPDGESIAYTAPIDPTNPLGAEPAAGDAPRVRATTRIDYKADGSGYLGELRRQVFVVRLQPNETVLLTRQLTTESLNHAAPRWSSDGKTIAVVIADPDGGSRLALVDADTGDVRKIAGLKNAGAPAWSPAGDRVLVAADPGRTGQSDLFVVDAASGEFRQITDDPGFQPGSPYPGLGEPTAAVWLDDHRALLPTYRAAQSALQIVDVETGRTELAHAFDSINAGFGVDAKRRYVVQGYNSPTATGEIVVYDRERDEARVVTSDNAAMLAEFPPARAERFTVERGGLAIDACLLLPPDFDPTKRYPVVLDVHGGPQMFYGHTVSPWQYPAQCLATNGFLVVYCNPRGSTSYGRDFAGRVRRDWAGEDFADLMAVVDAVAARPYADPARVGIYGYSYGGYTTAWAIGNTDRFKAAVCGAPVFDMESFHGTSDIGWHFGEWNFGGQPREAAEWYAAHSPSTFAHRATTPTLIIQGEADERCPLGQSEQMFVSLRRAGCEAELVRYPGGYHGFIREGFPEHRRVFIDRVLGWFKSHLGEPS